MINVQKTGTVTERGAQGVQEARCTSLKAQLDKFI